VQARLVRIPRHLLHLEFDDLDGLGVPGRMRLNLRGLIADLPLLPDARHSGLVIGPADVALACLAVLARHVGQGLRDYNLTLAHDRPRLRIERRKLVFLDTASLLEALECGDERPAREAVLFVSDAKPAVVPLLRVREARNLASFVAADALLAELSQWRVV